MQGPEGVWHVLERVMEHDEIEDSLHLVQRTIENVHVLDSSFLEEIVAGQIRKALTFETPEKDTSATADVEDSGGRLNARTTEPFPWIGTRIPLGFSIVDEDLRKEPAKWIPAIEGIAKALVVEEEAKRTRSMRNGRGGGLGALWWSTQVIIWIVWRKILRHVEDLEAGTRRTLEVRKAFPCTEHHLAYVVEAISSGITADATGRRCDTHHRQVSSESVSPAPLSRTLRVGR